MADMHARDSFGKAKYNTRLQPHNGRDALRDAYEEALDLVVYLRQAIYERDHPRVPDPPEERIEYGGKPYRPSRTAQFVKGFIKGWDKSVRRLMP